MKNKDKYDLRKIEVNTKYMIDGCGRRINNQCWLDLIVDGRYIKKDLKAHVGVLKAICAWLEEDED